MLKAYNDSTISLKEEDFYNMKLEAVQLAASCVAMLECFERNISRSYILNKSQNFSKENKELNGALDYIQEIIDDEEISLDKMRSKISNLLQSITDRGVINEDHC